MFGLQSFNKIPLTHRECQRVFTNADVASSVKALRPESGFLKNLLGRDREYTLVELNQQVERVISIIDERWWADGKRRR